MYKTVEEYVRANGYELSDLTPEEIKQAKKEMADINAGHEVIDGLFSSPLEKDLIKPD